MGRSPAPASELANGDRLVGVGQRVKKIGPATFQVYDLAFYVEPEAAALSLQDFTNLSHDEVAKEASFYEALVRGRFRKTFSLTFCRCVKKAALAGGFREGLARRLDNDKQAEGERVLDGFCPPDGVKTGDVIELCCQGDGETFELRFFPAANAANAGKTDADAALRLRLRSPGPKGVWSAVQRVYFDADTELTAIRRGAVERMPELLSSMKARQSADKAKEEAKEDAAKVAPEVLAQAVPVSQPQLGWSRKDWACFSGRTDGNPRYRFGDVTRGLTRRIRDRRSGAGVSSAEEELRSRCESLESEIRRLEEELRSCFKDAAEATPEAAVADSSASAALAQQSQASLPAQLLLAGVWGALGVAAASAHNGQLEVQRFGSFVCAFGRKWT
eukprot:TRINITY_DN11588_c0_g1_i1.p1 TRINITY_DN11588_c0_g1~~TRINITY_DN11588_c0_g1_i1.p1  ORF type:complete len:426 (+),score=109.71 TRINITY_DN11588_c0_g1_i1:113-1279(+)